jgi:hypothetical protein
VKACQVKRDRHPTRILVMLKIAVIGLRVLSHLKPRFFYIYSHIRDDINKQKTSVGQLDEAAT